MTLVASMGRSGRSGRSGISGPSGISGRRSRSGSSGKESDWKHSCDPIKRKNCILRHECSKSQKVVLLGISSTLSHRELLSELMMSNLCFSISE